MSLTAQEMVSAARQKITEIPVSEVKDRLATGYKILDVREPNEFDQGHLSGAMLIPRGMLEFSISTHPTFSNKTQPIIIYCKSGGRGALAALTLQEMGYNNVVSIAGGYDAWQQYQG